MLERTLYPSKTWPILGVTVFVTLALLFASKGNQDGRDAALVALICVLLCAVDLFPSAVYLKLTRQGFKYKNGFSAKFVKWGDVDHFTTYQGKYTQYVGWVYSDLAPLENYASFSRIFFLPRAVSRFLRLQIDDGFSVNFDSMSAARLASLLEQWRREHDDTTWIRVDIAPGQSNT